MIALWIILGIIAGSGVAFGILFGIGKYKQSQKDKSNKENLGEKPSTADVMTVEEKPHQQKLAVAKEVAKPVEVQVEETETKPVVETVIQDIATYNNPNAKL